MVCYIHPENQQNCITIFLNLTAFSFFKSQILIMIQSTNVSELSVHKFFFITLHYMFNIFLSVFFSFLFFSYSSSLSLSLSLSLSISLPI